MTTRYKNTSNYRNTPQNERFLDIYQPPIDVSRIETYRLKISAKYENRPDLLAYDLYREAKLWWIFTLFNRDTLLDPIFGLKPGIEILVPRNISSLGI